MDGILKKIFRPLLALSFFVLGASFFVTYVTVRLTVEDFSLSTIGLISSLYFGGIFIGAYYIEKWIAHHGHARVAALSILGFGLSALLMALWINGWYWGFIRFLMGIFTAGIYVSIESWLVIESTYKTRGQILSVYMIFLYTSYALGQFLLNIGSIQSPYAFAIIAISSLLALPWVAHTPIACPTQFAPSPLKIRHLLKTTPLGTFGVFCSGIILGVIYSLLPVYGKESGFDLSNISILMFLVVGGGLLFQWPLGKLSDYIDRRIVLLLICFFAFLVCLIPLFSQNFFFLLLSFFLGGFTFSIYPISTAHACDLLGKKDLIKVISSMIFIYGLGALIGPILAPFSMMIVGSNGLFIFIELFLSLLIASILVHFFIRPPAVKEKKIRFFPMAKTHKGIPLNQKKFPYDE